MKNIDIKIKTCRESIESLIKILKVIGTGVLVLIGLFGFIEEKFNIIVAQSIVAFTGFLILVIIFAIFRKYAIIEKLNLKERP